MLVTAAVAAAVAVAVAGSYCPLLLQHPSVLAAAPIPQIATFSRATIRPVSITLSLVWHSPFAAVFRFAAMNARCCSVHFYAPQRTCHTMRKVYATLCGSVCFCVLCLFLGKSQPAICHFQFPYACGPNKSPQTLVHVASATATAFIMPAAS